MIHSQVQVNYTELLLIEKRKSIAFLFYLFASTNIFVNVKPALVSR